MMRILLAEDDFASRKFMMRMLSKYGECDVTVDGAEALEAFTVALDANEGYDLVCLDIMMPGVDGYQALEKMREYEEIKKVVDSRRTKIIMTTALSEKRNVRRAFEMGCTAYAGKPINQAKFENVLKKLELIKTGS